VRSVDCCHLGRAFALTAVQFSVPCLALLIDGYL